MEMDPIRKTPYLKSLAHRGFVQGLTLSTSSNTSQQQQPNPSQAQETQVEEKMLCHYFGNIRYALPPPARWRRARPLPSEWSYGTRERPGLCTGGAGVCPQVGASSASTGGDGDGKRRRRRGMSVWRDAVKPRDGDGEEEDCFRCNVWVPVGSPPERGMYF